MKDTGSRLKQARLEKNISLEEVAQATKIKVQTIIALEEGDLDKLPKKAFIRGFVRTYGKYLKLNVNELLDQFHREMGSTQKQTLLQSNDTLSDDPAVQIANSKRNPFTRGVLIASIIVIIIVIYMTSRVIQKYQDEKLIADESLQVQPIENTNSAISTEATPPIAEEVIAIAEPAPTSSADTNLPQPSASPITSPAPTASPTLTATPALAVSPTPAATPAPTATPKPTPSPTPTPTPKPTPSPTPTATPTPKPTPSPTPTATPTPKPTPSPTPTATPTPKPTPAAAATSLRSQELIVEALDRVEIQFSTDKEKMIKVNLQPEQLYTIKAKGSIVFRASDGGAVNIIYNGRDQGVPGTLGVRLETKFPK